MRNQERQIYLIGFEVLVAMNMKIDVLWDVKPSIFADRYQHSE
jgi:hypothetical protein